MCNFFRLNRIDISKFTPEERIIPTLLHEFAHYVHYKIDPDVLKNGGTLSVLFDSEDETILEELFKVTNFVDKQKQAKAPAEPEIETVVVTE